MIDVKDLTIAYGKGQDVVKDLNLHVEKGTIHGLIGHNGSGKTTIIKSLVGIYPGEGGSVKIDGHNVYDNPIVKEAIGYVADSNYIPPHYRIRWILRRYKEMYPDFSEDEFDKLNGIFRVDVKKKIGQLSKGQQMRVSFMLNMARRPKVMILDEPTSGLDAMAKKDLLDILVSAVENDEMTVLISSHHLSELEKICDSVTILGHGEVMIDADLEEVTSQIAKYQVVFPEGAPARLYHWGPMYHMSNMGSVYTVVLPRASEEFEAAMRKEGAVVVEQMTLGLEESFIYMNHDDEGGEGL